MTRRAFDLWSPAVGASGGVLAYGTWGRPVLVFPSEAGKASDFEYNGMVDAVAELLDAGRVKLYCVDSYDSRVLVRTAASRWRSGPGGTARRVVDPRPGRPVDPRRLRRLASRSSPSARAWAPTTPPTSRCAEPTCSRRPCACPATTTRRPGTAGASRARRCTSTTRWPTSRICTAITWPGCATGVHLTLVCGQGMWEDTTGALASTRALAGPARREGHPARAGRLGSRRRARLAVVAAPARPPPAPGCAERSMRSERTTLRRAVDRHLVGLLLGTEEDWPAAFETLVRRLGPVRAGSRRRARLRRRADHHRAVRPARPSRATSW